MVGKEYNLSLNIIGSRNNERQEEVEDVKRKEKEDIDVGQPNTKYFHACFAIKRKEKEDFDVGNKWYLSRRGGGCQKRSEEVFRRQLCRGGFQKTSPRGLEFQNLSLEDNLFLIAPITEEIKEAGWGVMKKNSGLD